MVLAQEPPETSRAGPSRRYRNSLRSSSISVMAPRSSSSSSHQRVLGVGQHVDDGVADAQHVVPIGVGIREMHAFVNLFAMAAVSDYSGRPALSTAPASAGSPRTGLACCTISVRAFGMLGEPRVRGVLWLGIGLSLATLAACSRRRGVGELGFQHRLWLARPHLPGAGRAGHRWSSPGSCSPASSSRVSSVFLDRVVDATEARYLPAFCPRPARSRSRRPCRRR